MSFQVTVLKVLAGQPEGRLSLADLKRDVAILISSGRDWTDRTTRLAARAPGLDIFGQALVIRDAAGWRITDEGRERVASIERMPDRAPAQRELLAEDVAAEVAPAVAVTLPEVPSLTGSATRRDRRRERRSARHTSRSAVA